MRFLIAAGALAALAACDSSTTTASNEAGETAGGYTLEVRADEAQRTYIVTAPDGGQAATQVVDGMSTMLNADGIRALGEMQAMDEGALEVFALRVPGVNISVAADEDNPNSESANVRINAGGRSVHVDAQEGGPGDGDDRANVRITGATESDARDFINDAEDVSVEAKTQMLAALRLE